jgi:hypothetical protein
MEQNANMRYLLDQCLPHIESQAGAEKMLDGFKPKKRPIDALVEEVKKAIKS